MVLYNYGEGGATMAWRGYLGKTMQELRFVFCVNAAESAGLQYVFPDIEPRLLADKETYDTSDGGHF